MFLILESGAQSPSSFGTSSTLQPGGYSQPQFGQATPTTLTSSSHSPGISSHSTGTSFTPSSSATGYPAAASPSSASGVFPPSIDGSTNFPIAPTSSGSTFPGSVPSHTSHTSHSSHSSHPKGGNRFVQSIYLIS